MSKMISHKLVDVARRELGAEMDKGLQTSDWSGGLDAGMLQYAAEDSRILLPILKSLEKKVDDAGLEQVMDIEHRALHGIVSMGSAGVPFDATGWRERLEEIEDEKARLADELKRIAPQKSGGGEWNWNSHNQVKDAFALVNVALPDTKESTLARYDHPLARTLVNYRRASKMLSTYGQNLLDRVEDGRIYASWQQIGAQTGRMACSSPNLQNLPPEVRRYVRAPEGRVLVKADYSQIELRIAAKIARDKKMLEAFEKDEDIHTTTARSLVGRDEVSSDERKLAKAVNFGLLYGMGSESLKIYAQANYGVALTSREAKEYHERFFRTYLGLKRWHTRAGDELRRGRTETRTLTGRRRIGVTRFTERLNSPVQGTGADGLKLALALLYERREECPDALPILAVHDEIVVECDESTAEETEVWLERAMVDGMEEALNSGGSGMPTVPVKVEVEVCERWTE